ncbi:MAG: metal-dependent hydrolase [Methanomicrobiaceae archaeon]|nr:metal-dependent hydrolase [Methanomicrobiaceae archaeon]
MRIEHLIYSAAIAVIIGMVYSRYTGRDPSWIIVISAFAPDIDTLPDPLYSWSGVAITLNGNLVQHGDFHSILALGTYALLMGVFLMPLGIRLWEGMLFAGIGFGAHLFEDALVYEVSYALFWPFSDQKCGIGLFNYSRDFYGIADTQVLIIGLVLLGGAVALRKVLDRDWLSWRTEHPERVLR